MRPVANPNRTRWSADRCAICNHPEHPRGQHVFTTWAQLEAAVASQPSEPAGAVERRYVEQWRPE